MGGTRHGRNCTNHAQFTYHERQRAKREGNYGTRSARVGRDSMRAFDCCVISLTNCKNPMLSKQGYIFDRESLLEYIVARKTAYKADSKEWEKQKKMLDAALERSKEVAHETRVTKFLAEETSVTGSRAIFATEGKEGASAATDLSAGMKYDAAKLPTFWMPREDATPTMKPKPSPEVKCPVSGKPIKMRDMVPVTFTPIDDGTNLAGRSDNARYMCPLSRVTLTNSVRCVALKPSGKVIAEECVKEFISKDMLDPFTGDKLTKADIIKLANEGTGFGVTAKVAKVETAVLTVG